MSTVAVLGASGGVGRRVVTRALALGWNVVAQTRNASRLQGLPSSCRIEAFDPRDAIGLEAFVRGADVVVFALGVDTVGPTRFFSEVTSKLLDAMARAGVRRLIAITGVGTGDTRGHGGLLYDYLVYPLFTRQRYLDKDRQEAMIAASNLDWILVRPAPFSTKPGAGPLEVHTTIGPDTVLRRIGLDEVAEFVVQQFASDQYLKQRPFIGHR